MRVEALSMMDLLLWHDPNVQGQSERLHETSYGHPLLLYSADSHACAENLVVVMSSERKTPDPRGPICPPWFCKKPSDIDMLMKMWKLTLGNFYIRLALKFQLNILTLKRALYLHLKNSI